MLHSLLSKNVKVYRPINLPVILLCGCETWSRPLRNERVENRVLRRILGPKRDVTGEWRRLYNEEVNGLYSSPDIIWVIKARRMGMGGTCSTYWGRG
jgi:hypothetical protein